MNDTRLPSHADFRAALGELGVDPAPALVDRTREPRESTRSDSAGHWFDVDAPDSSALVWALGGVLAFVLLVAWIGRGTRRRGVPLASGKPTLTSRTRSRDLAAEGRFVEALVARYEELLAVLETRELLRRHPASTGRAYQRQLAAPHDAAFGALLRELYPARYGGASVDAGDFERWDHSARALEETA